MGSRIQHPESRSCISLIFAVLPNPPPIYHHSVRRIKKWAEFNTGPESRHFAWNICF